MTESLDERISKLSGEYRMIATKKTPLEIIRGDDKKLREKWAVRTLFYYLDPHAEHGINTDLLDYVLGSIDEDVDYTPSKLSRVQIDHEVVDDDDKRPDVLIWLDERSKRDFFICCEVKVKAGERGDRDYEDDKHQTEKYAEAEKFSSIGLSKDSIPEENHHYLYLKTEDSETPESDSFNSISWKQIANTLQSWLNEVKDSGDVEDGDIDYPIQTLVQIDMFIKSIRRKICDSDDETRGELAELYVKYYDEISEIEDAG
jgi:hypothetical protein